MAFIPAFENDIFVSYARLDNTSIGPPTSGWVDGLVARVDREVRQRLGTKELKVWIDKRLDGNRPITPEIVRNVRRSAVLMVVMSPGYVNSEWCRRERVEFLSTVGDLLAEGRVFVVHAREVDRQSIPAEFGDLLGYQFWTRDDDSGVDRPLGLADPLEQKFISRIFELSHGIKGALQRLRGNAIQPPQRTCAPDAPAVFVARSSEDLEDREDELRGYLRQAGLSILPETWYPQTDEHAFTEAMLTDLRRCRAFAQLLSAGRGYTLPFSSGPRLVRLQHDIAARTEVPRLLWRERSLDVSTARDPLQRELLAQARACGIEEFKRAVVEETRKEPPRSAPPSTNVMVFVNADSPDRTLARNVGTLLGELGVECYWPLESGSPEAMRVDLEDNLRSCDGVLLIYGATGANWIRSQLRQGRKIISQRERPLSALAVFEGPPPEKDDLAAAVPQLLTLNCRAGLDVAVLKQFVTSLRR